MIGPDKFTDPAQGVVGSFGSFLTAYNVAHPGSPLSTTTPSALTNADLNKIMGAWGVDTSTHEAWGGRESQQRIRRGSGAVDLGSGRPGRGRSVDRSPPGRQGLSRATPVKAISMIF